MHRTGNNVNASAASLVTVHIRDLYYAAASQSDVIHCCAFYSPPSPCLLPSLKPAAAWGDSDTDTAPLETLDVFDLDQSPPSSPATQASQPSPFSLLAISDRRDRASYDAGICLPRPAPAPAMLEHLLPSGPSMSARAGKRALRRASASTSVATRVSADFALGSPDAGSSFFGALYDSYSLWELASVFSAIAWLLVCLAA
ncbi:hypothetical protein BD311DRAFT_808779 [Dichomitus squalens]|uniref:Uncharacterized protein n=1 Tax=Dichomitus squalens TaxID=114155 RepID=A0A4Q9MF63_9APHY|nr:hypothetical protein BD311DRAFT_808779 [Dichomitus squalens]